MAKKPERTPRLHALKLHPGYFDAAVELRKPFEIRRNDRDFQLGDYLLLEEYDPATKGYTGRHIHRRVLYLTTFMQRPGYVVMGLARATVAEVLASGAAKAKSDVDAAA